MNRFKKILYVLSEPINIQQPCSPSLLRAISVAKNNQAKLTVLLVLPKLMTPSFIDINKPSEEVLKEKILSQERTNLYKIIANLNETIDITFELRIGKIYIESIRSTLINNYDLVIKESDESNWVDRFIGSDDMHLLRKCPCPVWMMKNEDKTNYDKIIAAVDFETDSDSDNTTIDSSELNDTILTLASSLALSDFSDQHVVNIYNVPEEGYVSLWAEHPDKVKDRLYESEYSLRQYKMNTILDNLKNTIGEKSYQYLSPTTHIIQGIASQEIPRIASELQADLVVMGTVARTGIAGVIIGNTAETVLYQLKCSVLAIKPKGFISPVSLD